MDIHNNSGNRKSREKKKVPVFLGRYRMVAMKACDSYLDGFD